ncbi:glyoxalase family protein [Synechococcus sp. PCC 7335]|uniref:VOC family protein n=1 Tax=Synechococcus sp. (strain ATCC 29403 / PCC 7335) TaxID=91464 RepID=UPI00017EE051|nr:VOC family protein [Synechococcus sp. PCC 7335]EDX84155.1 glyoxalase family protein [Synechococcus sp. PCC 7335]
MSTIFHLSFPIADIPQTKHFYVEGLGCEVGREGKGSLILNLGGHQLVAHVVKEPTTAQTGIYPRHFGLTFETEQEWEAALTRAKEKKLTFYQQPKHRFKGDRIEHRTFFLEDPFHNLLEFKYYVYPSAVFGEHQYSKVGDKTE